MRGEREERKIRTWSDTQQQRGKDDSCAKRERTVYYFSPSPPGASCSLSRCSFRRGAVGDQGRVAETFPVQTRWSTTAFEYFLVALLPSTSFFFQGAAPFLGRSIGTSKILTVAVIVHIVPLGSCTPALELAGWGGSTTSPPEGVPSSRIRTKYHMDSKGCTESWAVCMYRKRQLLHVNHI